MPSTTTLVALAAAAALTLACSTETRAGKVGSMAAAPGVRLASYNLNFGLAGDRDNVDAIAATAADIVVLQEANDAWERAITSDTALAARYPNHRFTPPTGNFAAGGMGILSAYPITKIDQLPPTHGALFFAWRIVVATPAGPLQILNLHLRPPISDRGSWIVGYYTTGENRAKELAAHVAHLDPTLPTIIAGDFNEPSSGTAVSSLPTLGYTDAIAQFHATDHTWRWPVLGGELRFQLDHVFYDRRLAPLGSQILDLGKSDHLPVVADFAIVTPIVTPATRL